MNPIWASTGALAAALAAFVALGLAMDRHYQDSFGRGTSPAGKRRWLQAGGTLGLLLSWGVCRGLRGGGQGTVLWCGLLTFSAVLVSLVLSFAPRHAVKVLMGATGVAAIALAIGL